MTNLPIVKTEDKWAERFLVRSVFGLNVLRSNEVECSLKTDPQLAFLHGVCVANSISINIGNLFDYADSPEGLFAGTDDVGKYRLVRLGCYGGEFYDSEQWDTFPPLFFERIFAEFLDITTHDESLIRKILLIDAIAFFISPRDKTSPGEVAALLNSPLVSSEAFIDKSLDFYRIIGFSQDAGDYFSFYARSEEDLSILEAPLASAVSIVRESEWYRKNQSELEWDDEFSMCLIKKTTANQS